MSLAVAPAAEAFCSKPAVLAGNASLVGELHGAPYGEAAFWCEIFIGANGIVTTKSCNPVLTQIGGIVTITLGGRLNLDPACAVGGYIDATFSTAAIPRRYLVQGRFDDRADSFIALGTNGAILAIPHSVMNFSVVGVPSS